MLEAFLNGVLVGAIAGSLIGLLFGVYCVEERGKEADEDRRMAERARAWETGRRVGL